MFRICKIITKNIEESNGLKRYFGNYPIEISENFPEDSVFDISTIIVGWDLVKEKFPNHKINEKKIKHNLEWTYSESECVEILNSESFTTSISNFINENLMTWLPSDFILYDSLLYGDFDSFIKSNIDNEQISYVHFNKGAIYIRNSDKNFTINVKNMFIVEEDYKTIIANFFNNLNCLVFSYDNIEDYADIDLLNNIKALDIIRWVKYEVETSIKYFQVIPNIDVSKYIPFLMSQMPTIELDEEEIVFFNRMCVKDKITRWMSNRLIPFSYEFDKEFNFIYREHSKLAKINYSSKRTITGRIMSADKYNPQNLKKEGKDRSNIISNFKNGKIYQFDYIAFESKIATYLTEDEEFIQKYHNVDLHYQTASMLFDTLDCDKEQREYAKLINMNILYGGGEASILKKLEIFDNPYDKMVKIKDFFEPIFNKSKELVEESKEKGYLVNGWGSIIKPNKEFASFNNYLQSTAAEITVDKVIIIKELLKKYKSQFLFQVHDSFIFDIHPDEEELVEIISNSLLKINGMEFTIEYKSGPNYRDLA